MSRIGKQTVALPKGVTMTVASDRIAVKGTKGELSMAPNALVEVTQQDGTVTFVRKDDSRKARAAHGLVRALCANMVKGVSTGFERKLEINGVGYRAEVKGKEVVLQLGYSHPINYALPDGVDAKVEKNILILSGIDRQKVGAAAAKVRGFRPPEPYKGKGVKYVEEQILRKVGKAAG
ncbi:MAG TPA: 50S ribosomal protein L6 [Kofleriaceae bacterium]|nr:50S ribosomal protein L6 [Kofleriaceae bacterium]